MGVQPITAPQLSLVSARPYRNRNEPEDGGAASLTPAQASWPAKRAEEDSAPLRMAAIPRLTVSELSPDQVRHGAWASQIPPQAIFYDEIDTIARGHRDLGVLIDQSG